jgi:hypothetical protein
MSLCLPKLRPLVLAHPLVYWHRNSRELFLLETVPRRIQPLGGRAMTAQERRTELLEVALTKAWAEENADLVAGQPQWILFHPLFAKKEAEAPTPPKAEEAPIQKAFQLSLAFGEEALP